MNNDIKLNFLNKFESDDDSCNSIWIWVES